MGTQQKNQDSKMLIFALLFVDFTKNVQNYLLNTCRPTSLMKYFFETGAIFFKCVIVLQFIDLLQKSELEKVYFCACGISFCKTSQKPKSARKSDLAVHIWMPFT